MDKIDYSQYVNKVDLLTGGVPCQSFSQAGLRKGLDDPRGDLMIKFIEILSFLYSVKKRNEKINPNKYDPLFPKNIFPLIFKMKKNNKVIPKVTKKKLKTL